MVCRSGDSNDRLADRFGVRSEHARSAFWDFTYRHYSEKSGSHADIRLWSTPDMDDSLKSQLYQKIAEENKKSKFYDVLTSKFSDPLNKERKPVFINIDRLA